MTLSFGPEALETVKKSGSTPPLFSIGFYMYYIHEFIVHSFKPKVFS